MKITLVRKIKEDGTDCQKCQDVIDQMAKHDQLKFLDRIVDADERDETSEGFMLATKYNVSRAPFFLVEYPDGSHQIFTVYLKFVKEVLEQDTDKKAELQDTLTSMTDDLDFL
ncbi:hypothetical protein ACFOEK_09310 [Litoribrevibacter euphylliae]|uniref:Thioredoxin domain-containing protein n=1 Tax=Litoribrevibacter euphylliae TaxID=1834034 RepID=A0ABV7HGF4_9GAMM